MITHPFDHEVEALLGFAELKLTAAGRLGLVGTPGKATGAASDRNAEQRVLVVSYCHIGGLRVVKKGA
jgi:hypothetical protein